MLMGLRRGGGAMGACMGKWLSPGWSSAVDETVHWDAVELRNGLLDENGPLALGLVATIDAPLWFCWIIVGVGADLA